MHSNHSSDIQQNPMSFMGNPVMVAEVMVENKDKDQVLKSLLKIVSIQCQHFGAAASITALFGECQFRKSVSSSFAFDEENTSSSYRKEIAHISTKLQRPPV